MKLFRRMKDGGPESPVIGYFLVEIKSLFSVVLLHFDGTREAYHSHAFNAKTFWLKGSVLEISCDADGRQVPREWRAGQLKSTPRRLMHKILPITDAWAVSFRGPWVKTWQEYKNGRYVTLTHGRKIVELETK